MNQYQVLSEMANNDFGAREPVKDTALNKGLDMNAQLTMELTDCAHQPLPLIVNGLHLVWVRPLIVRSIPEICTLGWK